MIHYIIYHSLAMHYLSFTLTLVYIVQGECVVSLIKKCCETKINNQ